MERSSASGERGALAPDTVILPVYQSSTNTSKNTPERHGTRRTGFTAKRLDSVTRRHVAKRRKTGEWVPSPDVNASPQKIAVFGAGYVGLVTGACFADLGHEVVIRDILAHRVEALRRGEVPIYEPGLDELLARNAERVAFTIDVGEAIQGADSWSSQSARRRPTPATPTSPPCWTVIDELPQIDAGASS